MTQPPNQPGAGQNDWSAQDPQGGSPEPQGTPNPGYSQQPQQGGYDQQPQQGGYEQAPNPGYSQAPQGGYEQQPQSFEQQAAFGAAGGPAAFPEKQSGAQKVKRILSIVVAVVLVGVAGWSLWSNYQSDKALAVGNCLVITGESDDADHELVDCDDSTTFSYLVAKVIDGAGSCGPDYVEYTVSTERRGNTTTNKVTCLIENLHAGNCYVETSDVMGIGIGDCSDPNAMFKVTAVEDSADATCGADESPYSFTEPARTYCLADPV